MPDRVLPLLIGVPWSGNGRARSTLNNDGVPLELCVSSGRTGVRSRFIGDPNTGLSPLHRFSASVEAAFEVLAVTDSKGLRPLLQTTIDRTLPADDPGRATLRNGALWLAAEANAGPGMAVYTTLDWDSPDKTTRWQRAGAWLSAILPKGRALGQLIPALAQHCQPVSAGLEGQTMGDVRAKLYLRLRRAAPFSDLGCELFADPLVLSFLGKVLSHRTIPLQGLVLSTSFSVATGELTDIKVDVCGHCVPRRAHAWQTLITELCGLAAVKPISVASALLERNVEIAFVGIGRGRDGGSRVNVYLKACR